MAIFIACSWNSGTPSVFAQHLLPTRVTDRRPAPAPADACRYGMHHVALNGAGPHDRDLDHEIVELLLGFSRGSIDIWARLSIWNTPIVSARLDHVGRRQASSCSCRERSAMLYSRGAIMPSAAGRSPSSGRTACRVPARRSSRSCSARRGRPCPIRPTVRSAMAALADRHHVVEPRAGDDEAAGVLRQVARKARASSSASAQHLRPRRLLLRVEPDAARLIRPGRHRSTNSPRRCRDSAETTSSDRPNALPTSRNAERVR